MSPGLMARSRVDPSALERIDFNQMSIHTPPPPGGWSANNASAQHINTPPISRPGQPDAGQYFYPGPSLGFFSGPDEQPSMVSSASGTFAQIGYPVVGTGNGQSFTNGGGQAFDSFFNGNVGLSGPFGEAPLVNSNAVGFGGFGLNANNQNGHLHGMHSPSYQQAVQPPPPPPPLLSTTMSPCCSQKTQQQRQPANDSARHTPTSSTNSLTSFGEGTSISKSCCSGSPATASSSSSGSMLKSESVDGASASINLSSIPLVSSGGALNGDTLPHLTNAHDGLSTQFELPLNQPVYSGFSQQQGHTNGTPAWYRFPPEYGTVTAPLQWSQWRAGLTYTSGPNANAFGSALQQPPNQQHSHQPYGNGTAQPPFVVQQHNGTILDGNGDSDTAQHDSHMCSCGDGCECVGCLVHPYNNATRSTVQSMWSLMDDASSTASSARTATATPSMRTPLMSQQQQGEQGFTPSDTSGASDDELILPAGDFLFVSYPIMGCDGEGMTCPCGDDCQCVGCTIHNNAL
ncbi:hypothetical protein SEPCBS119000_001461 [Sporothrix epigloea]|uniref:Copper-activated transcription factor n=1 Tax=Sporothrix epigloea TaxID=1892477 RepID=A0ABP0DAV0_9PEZI